MSILAESVVVQRSGATVLNCQHLTLDQRPTLLLGANGAGKTTLLSVLAGQVEPSEGYVQASGRVALVEQSFRPIVGFSSAEYCAYVAWLHGQNRKRARDKSRYWLEFVDLSRVSQQRCESLSGGERARLAIATALNSGAEILLLDEPSAALDPLNKQAITEIYQRVADAGQTLVVSTHDAGELQRPFERVVVLDHGVIHFDGERSEFLELAAQRGNTPAHILARSFAQRRSNGAP